MESGPQPQDQDPPLPSEGMLPAPGDVDRARRAFTAPFYLLFRPKLFFQPGGRSPRTFVLVLFVFLAGVSIGIERIDLKFLAADAGVGGRSALMERLKNDWVAYWMACTTGGVLSCLFWLPIAGWWYYKRLRWCGAAIPGTKDMLAVYLYASLVETVPAVLSILWQTAAYRTPAEAWWEEDWGSMAALLFLFWSLYTSYRGARNAFEARRWPARFWFVLFPASFYILVYGAVALVLLRVERPDLTAPRKFSRPGFSLHYPANWEIDTADADYDPDASFSIEPSFADAVVVFQLGDPSLDPNDVVEGIVSGCLENCACLSKLAMDHWGQYAGTGYRLVLDCDGTEYRGLVFSAATEDAHFSVHEICAAGASARQEPGFELIRASFRIHDARPQVERPKQLERPHFTLRYPGNWIIDTDSPDYHPDDQFAIAPPFADAGVTFELYDLAVNAARELEESVDSLTADFTLETREPIGSWGSHKGRGYSLGMYAGNTSYRGLVFLGMTDTKAFKVVEVCISDQQERQEAGFRLIRDTFQLREGASPDGEESK